MISQLLEMGAAGFEQTGTHLLVYFEENSFPSYEVNELLKYFKVEVNTIKEQNWNEVWESNFEPVVVGDFCAIRADFHPPITQVQYEIVITPKMSFGTGHHATTHMMIEHMQHIDFSGKEVFDFGTGTGILAILAEKLGAASVTAIDVDEWSYENARENAEKNNCTKIAVELSSNLPSSKTYDVVLANINKNVLLQYAPLLKGIIKDGGILLLSGLLKEDKEDIVTAFSKFNFQLKAERTRNNWLSLLFVTCL